MNDANRYQPQLGHIFGRKQSNIWQNFVTKKQNNKIVSNRCKDCYQEVSGRPKRMQTHLEKCSKLHKNVKLKYAKSQSIALINIDNSASEPVPSASVPVPSASGSSGTIPVNKSKTIMDCFIRKVKPHEQNELDLMLGKFIFSSNLSFNSVENPYFQNLLEKLNPAYKIPSRRAIGGSILDNVYEQTEDIMTENLKGKKVTITQDGWSTNQMEPVICHSISTGEETYFFNCVQTEEQSKDSDKCLAILLKAIDDAEKKYECKVVAVVTDNCSVMTSMRTKIQDNYPHMIVLGCNSHYLNNLGNHFTPEDIKKQVQKVHTYIRSHHFTSACLKQLEINRPVLPGATRWNSQIDSFLSYTHNQLEYVKILREYKKTCSKKEGDRKMTQAESDKLQEIQDIVSNNDLFDQIKDIIKALTPICTALDLVSKFDELFINNNARVNGTDATYIGTDTFIYLAAR
jgi:hypothetical protein